MGGKRVQFGEVLRIGVQEIEPIANQAAIWWTKNEIRESEREYETVLFLMEANKPIDEEEHSIRGLEKKTEAGAWALYENQRDAVNAVLGEQEKLQRKRTKDDSSELIANVYQEVTSKTRLVALERGGQDCAEIKDYLNGNSHCRVPSSPKPQVRNVSPPGSPARTSPSKRGWGRKISMPLMSPKAMHHEDLQSSPFKEKIVKAAAMALARQQVSAKKMTVPRDDCSFKDDESFLSLTSLKRDASSKAGSCSIAGDESILSLTSLKPEKKSSKRDSDGKKAKRSSKSKSKSNSSSPEKQKRQNSTSTIKPVKVAESDLLIGGTIVVKHENLNASAEPKSQKIKQKKSEGTFESRSPTKRGDKAVRPKDAKSKSSSKTSKPTKLHADGSRVEAETVKLNHEERATKPKSTFKKSSAETDLPRKKTRKTTKTREGEPSSSSKKASSKSRLTRSNSFTSMEKQLAKLATSRDARSVKKLPDERSSASTERCDSCDDDERSLSYLPGTISTTSSLLSSSAISPSRRFMNRVMKGVRRNKKTDPDSSIPCLNDMSQGDYSESADSCCF